MAARWRVSPVEAPHYTRFRREPLLPLNAVALLAKLLRHPPPLQWSRDEKSFVDLQRSSQQ